jgi:hypothetical protein
VSLATRQNVRLAGAITVLLALQFALGNIGTHHPWVGAFHGLTALAVAAAVGTNARQAMHP